jgi:hypothetical protein
MNGVIMLISGEEQDSPQSRILPPALADDDQLNNHSRNIPAGCFRQKMVAWLLLQPGDS